MGAYFLDSILVYILGENMSHPFDFWERGERPLGFLDHCHIHHYIHFYVTYLHALMQPDPHSLFYLFASSIFILFLHFTLPHLISFFSHPA